KKNRGIRKFLSESVTEAHNYNKEDLSKYRTLFKKYKLKKIIEAPSFDDSHWVIVDFIGNRRNLYYDLKKYPNLNKALKCFILINIYSVFTLSFIESFHSKLKNIIHFISRNNINIKKDIRKRIKYSEKKYNFNKSQ